MSTICSAYNFIIIYWVGKVVVDGMEESRELSDMLKVVEEWQLTSSVWWMTSHDALEQRHF